MVIISSKMGSIGDGRTGGNLYGYRMSKAAANCAGATLARDLKEEEIAVGLIHPGAVSDTSLNIVVPSAVRTIEAVVTVMPRLPLQ